MGHPYTHTTTNEDLRAENTRLESDNDRLGVENSKLRSQCSQAASQKRQYIFFRLLCCLPLLVWATVRICAYVNYRQHFYTPLKTAIETKDVETAKRNLEKALVYLNGYTRRDTTVIFEESSDHNVGALMSDIVYLINNLRAVSNTNYVSTLEERRIALGSIYCVLTNPTSSDPGSGELQTPEGISIHPYNVPMFWFGVLGGFMAFIALGPSISRISKKWLKKREQRRQAKWEALSPHARHARFYGF